jgi:phage baseplate assembly protein W
MIDVGVLFGRGISFPPRVSADGHVVWSQGEDNIREAIRIILLTQLKERIQLPEFGGSLSNFLFEPNTPAIHHQIEDRIGRALEKWEPRIHVDSVAVAADPSDAESAIATITYRLVATQVQQQMNLSVKLAGG